MSWRLDARVGFVAVLSMGTAVFMVKDLLFLLVLLLIVLVSAVLVRERLSRYGRGAKGLLLMLALVCVVQAVLVPGQPLVTFEVLGLNVGLVTVEGLELGGRVMARVGVLVFSSLLFTAIVREREFMDALLSLKVPYPIVFSVNLVLRLLPRLMEDAANIRDAFKMRRVGSGRGYLSRWQDLGRTVKPLFVTSMVSAHRLGVSLELRGYDGTKPWKGRSEKLSAVDLVVMIVIVVVLTTAVLSLATGYGPSVLFQRIGAERGFQVGPGVLDPVELPHLVYDEMGKVVRVLGLDS